MPDELIPDVAAPTDSSQSGPGDDGERPITAKELNALVEANRVSQGQARRAEAVATQAQTTINMLLARLNQPQTTKVQDSIEDTLDRLDESDPALAVVKQALKADRAKLRQLEGYVARSNATQQQETEREYTVQQLGRVARAAKVPIEVVMTRVGHLPPAQMWAEGLDAIDSATGGDDGGDEERIRREERERVGKKLGLFQDRRTSGGGGGGPISRAEIAGMTPAEYAKNRDRIQAQYKGR